MKLRPFFYKRDYSKSPVQYDWLPVAAASWSAVGGCDAARLAGFNAGRIDLPALIGLLRCPVDLQAEDGTPAWWGYVNGFELWAGNMGAICSLDRLSNKVRTRYNSLEGRPGDPSLKMETLSTYANNLESQAIYGIKEKMVNLLAATRSQAEAARDVELLDYAWPAVLPAQRESAYSLVLDLRGWWHTTSWRHYYQPAGMIEYQGESTVQQAIGNGAARARVGQPFFISTSTGWRADSVWIRCRKVGAPGDYLGVHIYVDNGAGVPGVEQAVFWLHNPDVPVDFKWMRFDFPTPAAMAGSTTYWVVVDRSGAANADNYYEIYIDENLGFGDGNLKIYNGTTWNLRSPLDANMYFRVIGSIETTEQLKLMAASDAGGQFFSSVTVDLASGIYSNPQRDGTAPAQAELEETLAAGTSGGVRLLADVDQARALRIYGQPAAATATLRIDGQGAICDRYLNRLPAWGRPAGQWAVVDSAWKGQGSGTARISDRVFLQAVDWEPAGGYLKVGSW